MDPIVTKLNEAITKQVKSTSTGLGGSQGSSPFQRTFEQTMSDRILEKLQNHIQAGERQEMNVVSAEDVQVRVENAEMGAKDAASDGSGQYMDFMKEMNRDLLSLDATLETLTTPGIKLNPRQLLALQAGVANTTLLAESFSRFTEVVARGIQSMIQMQV